MWVIVFKCLGTYVSGTVYNTSLYTTEEKEQEKAGTGGAVLNFKQNRSKRTMRSSKKVYEQEEQGKVGAREGKAGARAGEGSRVGPGPG